jgi:phage shock protein A
MDPEKLKAYLLSRSTAHDVIDGALALLSAESPKAAGLIAELQTANSAWAAKCKELEGKIAALDTDLAAANSKLGQAPAAASAAGVSSPA